MMWSKNALRMGCIRMMVDREKVIKGLELLAHWPAGLIFPDKEKWINPCCKMAVAMLKEQEARVLTLDEAAADQEVWTEAKLRGTERIPLFISILWLTDDAKDFELELIGTSRRAFMLAKEYGKTWRCWSSKPTDEQREAVKWDGK